MKIVESLSHKKPKHINFTKNLAKQSLHESTWSLSHKKQKHINFTKDLADHHTWIILSSQMQTQLQSYNEKIRRLKVKTSECNLYGKMNGF